MKALAERERMFRRTRRVLVALSGGADSVACLLVLREFGTELGFEVTACHFDHKLRAESAMDLERVRVLCERLGVECITGEGDVAGVAAQQKRGLEDVAREMRYQFLAFVAEKTESDAIATGHTADDQAETVLMRIVRGSGVRGIRGMLPVSEVPGAEAQRLLRPLLEMRRTETEAICAEAGIQPLEDPTNADTRFLRNRVRAETLPALATLNPSIHDALIGLAESAREAFEPLEKQSLAVQPRERGPVGAVFEATALASLPSEALLLLVERESTFYHLRVEGNRTVLRNLADVFARGSGSVSLGEAEVEVSCGLARVGPHLEEVEPFAGVVLNVPGDTRAGPWRVEVRTAPLETSPNSPAVAVDSTTVRGALRARPLEAGDRILIGGHERKVSDLFINEKVPAWERPGVVAVADGAGALALFGATRTFARDGGEPDLWIRLSALPPR